jgi:hypothetical protein
MAIEKDPVGNVARAKALRVLQNMQDKYKSFCRKDERDIQLEGDTLPASIDSAADTDSDSGDHNADLGEDITYLDEDEFHDATDRRRESAQKHLASLSGLHINLADPSLQLPAQGRDPSSAEFVSLAAITAADKLKNATRPTVLSQEHFVSPHASHEDAGEDIDNTTVHETKETTIVHQLDAAYADLAIQKAQTPSSNHAVPKAPSVPVGSLPIDHPTISTAVAEYSILQLATGP